jgi:tRNA-dihydrouridine synthase B
MADMTDSPFCRIIREIGGCDVVFREMVSSEAIIRENKKTFKMADFEKKERPIILQIFGSKPSVMAQAAVLLKEKYDPDGIDINMGCPVQKMTSNFNGAALMKDPALAAEIVKEVKKNIGKTPVSVKIRLGWSDPDEFQVFLPVLEEAGADLITLHGRTKQQGYSGKADWERILRAKMLIRKPLIANGDISSPELVQSALDTTKADGIAIGRGCLGNPWFFAVAQGIIKKPKLEERIKIIQKHAKYHLAHYGEKSILTFRKHALHYFKSDKLGITVKDIKQIRARLARINSLEELNNILDELL